MISKTQSQIYTIHYILEQNNHPGYRTYMPTYKHYYNTHLSCYKDMEYEAVDKRDHGWCDIIVRNKDATIKYYKFIEIGVEPIYKGWLKKWAKIADNRHFVVFYTNNKAIQDNKYSIYSYRSIQDNLNKYLTGSFDTKEWTIPDQFYDKEAISIDFSPITSTRRVQDLKQCFEYAIDNPWEYLTHKSSGFVYIYKNWTYYSLSDVYENTIYSCKYSSCEGFRKAFQRGKIVDIQKVPVSYLEDVESNIDAKEVSLLRKAPQPTNVVYYESRKQELSGCPKANSSLPVSGMEQKETVSRKSKEQMTSQDNKPMSISMWRDESVGTNTNEWEHLRILMEEERKNKVVKPVKVYKCKK